MEASEEAVAAPVQQFGPLSSPATWSALWAVAALLVLVVARRGLRGT